MASPTVWTAARARIQAVATAEAVTVAWPNEATQEPEVDGSGNLPLWAAVEIEADAAAPYEVGGSMWQERGRVSVHVFAPTGSGIDDVLALRKAFADGFRGVEPGALIWDGFAFPPGGALSDDGNWARYTLGVSYRWTDA
jgi:hypothetical protein